MTSINPNNLTREQVARHLKAAKKAHDTDSVAKLSAILAKLGGPAPPVKETKRQKCLRLIDEATEVRDSASANTLQEILVGLEASGRADEPWDAPEKVVAVVPESPVTDLGTVIEPDAPKPEAEPEPQEGPPPVFLAVILDQADADLLANNKQITTLEGLEEFFEGADSPDVALQSVEGIGRVTSARILSAIAAFKVERDAIVENEDASEIAREETVGEGALDLAVSERGIEREGAES